MALRDELIGWLEGLSELLSLHDVAGRRAFLLRAGLDDRILRSIEAASPVKLVKSVIKPVLLR